jgi:hydroxymethylbilane synthase
MKLDAGECDAIVLAAAGLNRLGLSDVVTELFDPVAAPPAPGQGALAIQCRMEDAGAAWLKALHHLPTELCVAAERGALEALEGSCRTAIGAHARLDGDDLRLTVEALSADGRKRWRRDGTIPRVADLDVIHAFGRELGRSIRDEAGDALIVAP